MLLESSQDRVFAFVARERNEPKGKLALSTTLLEGLGMDGDDAVEFFQKFEKEFSVDLRGLEENWNSYFGPEGVSLGTAFFVVWDRFFRAKHSPQITIQDLVDCVRAGKWTKTLPKEVEQKRLTARIVK